MITLQKILNTDGIFETWMMRDGVKYGLATFEVHGRQFKPIVNIYDGSCRKYVMWRGGLCGSIEGAMKASRDKLVNILSKLQNSHCIHGIQYETCKR